jgi:hypothetical protein
VEGRRVIAQQRNHGGDAAGENGKQEQLVREKAILKPSLFIDKIGVDEDKHENVRHGKHHQVKRFQKKMQDNIKRYETLQHQKIK